MSSSKQPFWSNRPLKSDAPTDPAAPMTAADGPLPTGAHVRVLVLEGPAAGTSVVVAGGNCTVGSDASCDVVLGDSSVSRCHARCELYSRAVRLTGVEPHHVVSYLGHTVNDVIVPYGSTLRIGQSRLCFERQEKSGRSKEPELAGLRGESEAMRRVFFTLQRLAALDTTVLVQGAKGTGKKAAARTLHALSPRGAAPVAILEAETAQAQTLTKAIADAARGTLIITHVGELAAPLQRTLLAAIENRQLACRLLVTSTEELTDAVNDHLFEAKLYEAITPDVVELPTLDQRREDVGPLAARFAAAHGGTLSPEVLADLSRRSYPGNVRELEREVELMLRKRGPDGGARGYNALRDEAVQAFEAQYLAGLLERHQGNVSAAAREAGLSRSQFYRVLRRHPSLMSTVRAE